MSAQRPRGVKRNHLSMADGDSASVSDHSEDESPPGRQNKRQRGDDDGGSDDQPTATSTISALGEETRFITITGSGDGGEDGAGGDSVPATVWSDDDGEAASWYGGEGSLTRVTGDLLEAGEDYICHQTNCKSRGARGLAKALFARFPWANIYTDGSARIPGDIVVRHSPTGGPSVVGLNGQRGPGNARRKGADDTATCRVAWFKACLDACLDLPLPLGSASTTIGTAPSFAFPWLVGCGLAGGDWETYHSMIESFAEHRHVVLYQLPS